MSNEIIMFEEVKGMSSLQIAEVTGKNHKEVLRDIRNILERGASERNFALTSYSDKQGKEDDVAKRDTTDSIGRTQLLTYVNESGMYALVLGSKLESAKKFKRYSNKYYPKVFNTSNN